MDPSRLWACDRGLAPVQVAANVDASFPELRPARVTALGEGWDCLVFAVNDRFAFRFPRRAEVGPRLVAERALTRALAGALPLPIPEIVWTGEVGGWPFNGHVLIPGVPATAVELGPAARARIGAEAGRFIAALHAMPAKEPPRPALAEDLPAFLAAARQIFGALASLFSAERSERVRAFLAEPPPAPARRAPVLLHGELTASNLILDLRTRQIGGVIDWTDARTGDPAADFAGLFQHGGAAMLAAALAPYPAADDALAARARVIGGCGAFLRLAHALDRGEPARLARAWAVFDGL